VFKETNVIPAANPAWQLEECPHTGRNDVTKKGKTNKKKYRNTEIGKKETTSTTFSLPWSKKAMNIIYTNHCFLILTNSYQLIFYFRSKLSLTQFEI
jgi:hypothetical protein